MNRPLYFISAAAVAMTGGKVSFNTCKLISSIIVSLNGPFIFLDPREIKLSMTQLHFIQEN